MSKLVVVIQCHLVMNRCSGYPCMDAFYKREGAFASYEEDVRYMPVTCGGCCGAEVAAKLENLTKHLNCPHLDYMRQIAERKGYSVVLGSYISNAATKKREAGIYKTF